jgi:RNA-directed DNA polymerase
VKIPKAGKPGEWRPLGIPAVIDRVCQQALLQRLESVFEPLFDDSSFGFRPGRSTKDALRKIWGEIKAGAEWIVDADLKDYFGSVDHEKLMTLVAQRVADGRVLMLIEQMLTAGYQEQGRLFPTPQGTPQGGVVSPLLSNILLTPFDREMRRRGYQLTRYADDWVVTCRSRREAEAALRCAEKILATLGVTQSEQDADRACASRFCVPGIQDQVRQSGHVLAGCEDRLWGAARGSLCISDAKVDRPVQRYDSPEDPTPYSTFHCGVGTGA